MAKRKMLITLEIDVADVPRKEKTEDARMCGCKVSELPGLSDLVPFDVAEMIACDIVGNSDELFAGTDSFCRIIKAKPIAYKWKP